MRANLTPDSLTLDFPGTDRDCVLAVSDGNLSENGWWIEPDDCRGVSFVNVSYLLPSDGNEILFQPSYEGPLDVSVLPPGRPRALVEVSGLAGTGWFEGPAG